MTSPRARRAVRGKSCGGKRKEISSPQLVLAGLDPATHAFGHWKQRHGCADQIRARRLQMVSCKSKQVILAGEISPDSPARARVSPRPRRQVNNRRSTISTTPPALRHPRSYRRRIFASRSAPRTPTALPVAVRAATTDSDRIRAPVWSPWAPPASRTTRRDRNVKRNPPPRMAAARYAGFLKGKRAYQEANAICH